MTETAEARQAEAFRLPFEPLEHPVDDPSLWSEAPLELMVRYGCVPIRREGSNSWPIMSWMWGIVRSFTSNGQVRLTATPKARYASHNAHKPASTAAKTNPLRSIAIQYHIASRVSKAIRRSRPG